MNQQARLQIIENMKADAEDLMQNISIASLSLTKAQKVGLHVNLEHVRLAIVALQHKLGGK